jgi:CubicO group peptidase (beta-lactamase class C family)
MTVPAEQIPNLARSQRAALDRYLDIAIDTALAMNRLVGSVVVVAHFGDIVYELAAGFAEREPRKPMRLNTIFRLASLTKPIVSAGVLALVDQAKLSLDDPVTKRIPEFRPTLHDGREAMITIRQLPTHTAGISYGYSEPEGGPYHQANVSDGFDQPGLSMAENLRRLTSAPLVFEPGGSFQ